jgi:hypothetical protein
LDHNSSDGSEGSRCMATFGKYEAVHARPAAAFTATLEPT